MMGRGGSSSTTGAMHVGGALMAYAAGRAMRDGIQRANQLAAVDRAHALGQQRYAAIIRQRLAQQRAEAEVAAQRLMVNRKRLHG